MQRDLAAILPRAKIAGTVPMDEVLATVREAANWNSQRHQRPLSGASALRRRAARSVMPPTANPDPYAGFEARIVPENITLLPKNTSRHQHTPTSARSSSRRATTSRASCGSSAPCRKRSAPLRSVLGFRGRDNGLKEGQRLRVLLSPVPGGSRQQPARVIIANDVAIEAVIALSDLGRYVSVDVAAMNTASVAEARDDDEDDGSGVRLYQSIYETALRNQIPRPVIDDMIRVYSYDVDFQRKVQPGDSFDVLYAGEEEAPAGVETRNDVLFAALTVGGEFAEVLSLPDSRRQHRRLLRRDRKEREEIPGPQADLRRHPALRIRRAPPSDPRLRQDAYRRGLGRPARHRRSTRPAMARSRRSAGKAATANISASSTPTATRPPTAT